MTLQEGMASVHLPDAFNKTRLFPRASLRTNHCGRCFRAFCCDACNKDTLWQLPHVLPGMCFGGGGHSVSYLPMIDNLEGFLKCVFIYVYSVCEFECVWVNMCVYRCMYVPMWTHMYNLVDTRYWCQKSFSITLLMYAGKVSHLNPELTKFANLAC